MARLNEGISLPVVLSDVGLVRSRGEARRLIEQGGVYVNDVRVEDVDYLLDRGDVTAEGILLRIGKKRYHRLSVD